MTNLPQLTTVPTVVAALVTAFSAIPSDVVHTGHGTLEVFDGPAFSTNAHDMIAVGVGAPSIRHTLVREGRGVAYNEAYDINCLHWAWSGSRVMADHRARCLTVLAAIRTIVDALDVPLAVCRLGDSLEWTHSVSGDGASCSVQFSVHVSASL